MILVDVDLLLGSISAHRKLCRVNVCPLVHPILVLFITASACRFTPKTVPLGPASSLFAFPPTAAQSQSPGRQPCGPRWRWHAFQASCLAIPTGSGLLCHRHRSIVQNRKGHESPTPPAHACWSGS